MVIVPHPDDDRREASLVYQTLLVIAVTVFVAWVWFVVNEPRQKSDPVAPVHKKEPHRRQPTGALKGKRKHEHHDRKAGGRQGGGVLTLR